MLEQINKIPLTKSSIKELANLEVTHILENGKNPLEIIELSNALIEFAESIKKDTRFISYVRDEVSKFGKEHTTKNNTKIELAEVGTKYDYSDCNDFILPELNNKLEKAKKEVSEREAFLKSIPPKGIDLMNEETGELIKVYPPAKYSTSSVKVTLSK